MALLPLSSGESDKSGFARLFLFATVNGARAVVQLLEIHRVFAIEPNVHQLAQARERLAWVRKSVNPTNLDLPVLQVDGEFASESVTLQVLDSFADAFELYNLWSSC